MLTHGAEAAVPVRKDGSQASATRSGGFNSFLNELTYKPKGSRQSYLFYLPWLNHNFNAAFNLEDAGGPLLAKPDVDLLHRR